MKVQYVSIRPTELAEEKGCYSFTPELLASVGARYSRNNEGLDAIASKIDPENQEKSVDSIFKMLDYGHASIADMTPIALFIDDITLHAAFYLWTMSPTAGGQECSTRYIKIDESSAATSEELGMPPQYVTAYNAYVKSSFENYRKCLDAWTNIANTNPQVISWAATNGATSTAAFALKITNSSGTIVFDPINPVYWSTFATPSGVSTEIIMPKGGAWFTGVTKVKLADTASSNTDYYVGSKISIASKYVYEVTVAATYVAPAPAPSGGGGWDGWDPGNGGD
jgi:hypothetical protein